MLFFVLSENERCLLDVSQIELLNMDLYAGSLLSCGFVASVSNSSCVLFGGYLIEKKGPSLLQEKCELKLQVERNLMSSVTKIVPDLSIRGNITTLAIRLDVPQYRLVRGLLTYNIGENVAEIYQTIPVQVSHFTFPLSLFSYDRALAQLYWLSK